MDHLNPLQYAKSADAQQVDKHFAGIPYYQTGFFVRQVPGADTGSHPGVSRAAGRGERICGV